jgi:hypothetical protein
MKTFKVDSKFWRKLNTQTNVGSFLDHMYGLKKINDDGEQTTLLMDWNKVPMKSNSYGTAINAIAKVCDPVVMLELLDASYRKEANIYTFNRFTPDDSDNLIIYPCATPKIMNIMPGYCEKHYPGKYDFEFTSKNGLRSYNAIIYLDSVSSVMEDLSFLLLQDADAHALYEYKIKNDIKLEEYVDYTELKEKELI